MTVENVGIGGSSMFVEGEGIQLPAGMRNAQRGRAVFGRLAAVPELTANVAINGDVGNRG